MPLPLSLCPYCGEVSMYLRLRREHHYEGKPDDHHVPRHAKHTMMSVIPAMYYCGNCGHEKKVK